MRYTLLNPPVPLKISPRIDDRLRCGDLSSTQIEEFDQFLTTINHQFLHHRIILHNAYTHWFSLGMATDHELRHFIRQFSVFSNQFLVAALQKVINSPTLNQSRASREILLNELGVIYRNPNQSHKIKPSLSKDAQNREGVLRALLMAEFADFAPLTLNGCWVSPTIWG